MDVPLLDGFLYHLQLPNGEFIRIDLKANANGDWVVEHLDSTGEFRCGLQIDPEAN